MQSRDELPEINIVSMATKRRWVILDWLWDRQEHILAFDMTSFRAYLLDERGKIFHGEDIVASDQTAAIDAGSTLFERHSDTADGFEVWAGRELIFTTRGEGRPERHPNTRGGANRANRGCTHGACRQSRAPSSSEDVRRHRSRCHRDP